MNYKHVQGGGVPGGHNVIFDGRKPFITPMKECHSIPLRHSDVVVDLGAYVGTFAIYAARFPVRRVIAYEPSPQSYEILSLTKLVNMRCEEAAVVKNADRRSVTFYLSQGIGVTNSLIPSRKKIRCTVPAVGYAEAVHDATIIKIDIEGGEYTLPIASYIPDSLRALIIDFHPVPKYDWTAHAEQLIAKLESSGFAPVISPDWSNGWTCAGSWLRERPDSGKSCEVLLTGVKCCGCGASIVQAGVKALCPSCWTEWLPKHRTGFICAQRR